MRILTEWSCILLLLAALASGQKSKKVKVRKAEMNKTLSSGEVVDQADNAALNEVQDEPIRIEDRIDLTGRWRENQYKRTGLNDFLYYMGMNWFKRFYVTRTSWEDEQTIFQTGNVFRINGFKGPQAEVYAYTLTADNTTSSTVSMGENYGVMDGLTWFNDETDELTTDLTNRDTDKVEIVIKRSRKKGSNRMVQTMTHLPSKTVLTAIFFKQ